MREYLLNARHLLLMMGRWGHDTVILWRDVSAFGACCLEVVGRGLLWPGDNLCVHLYLQHVLPL